MTQATVPSPERIVSWYRLLPSNTLSMLTSTELGSGRIGSTATTAGSSFWRAAASSAAGAPNDRHGAEDDESPLHLRHAADDSSQSATGHPLLCCRAAKNRRTVYLARHGRRLPRCRVMNFTPYNTTKAGMLETPLETLWRQFTAD